MHRDLLGILCCPTCKGSLHIDGAGAEIETGTLTCAGCAATYPVVRGIPRFVPAENYAGSFGFQWNRFPRTQLDSHSGLAITRDRFFAMTAWSAGELRGKRVLDVGCGSGRFAEIAVSTGARVVAVDYSSAVDAAKNNLAGTGDIQFVQADAFQLPFRDGVFDYVYCLGVIQHTPDPRRAFLSILPPLREGGKIAVDAYPKLWKNLLWTKYWFRPFTRGMDRERLFRLVERAVGLLLPVSRVLGRVPVAGKALRWLMPIVNYEGVYPLSESQLREWSVLDTFDMYSPAHDHPQSADDLREWLIAGGLRDREVVRKGHFVARGTK